MRTLVADSTLAVYVVVHFVVLSALHAPHPWQVYVLAWLILASVALLNLLTAIFIEALTDSTNKGKREVSVVVHECSVGVQYRWL